MTALVLDAGALIALDRNTRSVWADFDSAVDAGNLVYVPAGVIGQVWRDRQRQVLLARALNNCEESTLNGEMARAARELCGWTGTVDVIDASVAFEAAEASRRGDVVLFTSDVEDMNRLLSALNVVVRVIKV